MSCLIAARNKISLANKVKSYKSILAPGHFYSMPYRCMESLPKRTWIKFMFSRQKLWGRSSQIIPYREMNFRLSVIYLHFHNASRPHKIKYLWLFEHIIEKVKRLFTCIQNHISPSLSDLIIAVCAVCIL